MIDDTPPRYPDVELDLDEAHAFPMVRARSMVAGEVASVLIPCRRIETALAIVLPADDGDFELRAHAERIARKGLTDLALARMTPSAS